MTAVEIVKRVIRSFQKHNVPYMLVGAFSSNAWGIARSTKDADFVIESTDRSLVPVFQELLPHIRFDTQTILEMVTFTTRYVGKHDLSAFTVELFVVSDDAFDRERFSRRIVQPFDDSEAFVQTAEDVILQKLRWFKLAARPKDLSDAKDVILVRREKLDLTYLHEWADKLEIRDLLEEAVRTAR